MSADAYGALWAGVRPGDVVSIRRVDDNAAETLQGQVVDVQMRRPRMAGGSIYWSVTLRDAQILPDAQ